MTEIKVNSCCEAPILELQRIFISDSACNGCGLCGEVCPFGLPAPNKSGKYEIKNPKKCIECSACKRNCPTQAIYMQEQKGCGCLWDAKKRLKNNNNDSCCC